MAGKKQDPFFTHLWDELSNAKILQLEGVQKWMDAPAKLQAQFVAAGTIRQAREDRILARLEGNLAAGRLRNPAPGASGTPGG